MKKFAAILAGATLAATLTACDGGTVPAEPAPTSSMDEMAMPTETRKAAGTGTITAIDMTNAKVTIDHGDIAELEWPSMNMGFEAERPALEGLRVGDRVDFEFDWDGRKGTLTSIQKSDG